MEDEVLETTAEFQEEEVVETEETTDSEFAAETEAEEIDAPAADAPAADDTEFSAEDNGADEFAKDEEEEEEDNKADSDSDSKDEEDEDKKPASNHSNEEFDALQEEVESLRAEVETLRAFKLNVENKEKDALINQYYMLSDEDKKEIIEHKTEFSLDEIKSKLAVLYVEKNVDFSVLSDDKEEVVAEEDPITSFSLETPVAGFAPSFLSALRQTVNG